MNTPLCEDQNVWTEILDIIDEETCCLTFARDDLQHHFSLLPDSIGDPISFSEEKTTTAVSSDFSFQELDFLSNLVEDENAFSAVAFKSDSPPKIDLVKTTSTKKHRRVCTMDGCDRIDRGHGLCGTHGGGRRCSVPNCSKASRKRGLCCGHYRHRFKLKL